ncbi:MAG: purine-binding chemotaxis protein CheW [Nitrospirae bacterium]|nr:purine-binding chemotaxis protein CheW [Nitrospirota bacterium]
MDIARIRKKAKEQEAGKRSEDRPAPPNVVIDSSVQEEVKAEIREQGVPEEDQHPGPETKNSEPPAQEASGSGTQADSNGQSDDDSLVELLTFSIGAEEFAFKVREVEEILRLQKMTKVPTMHDYVIGITSLRGKIIPVLDLKARLNLKQTGEAPEYGTEENPGGGREAKILIIEGPQGFIGATIDRVMGVVSVEKDRVIEPPAHLSEAEIKYIEGIVILEKRFISVLRAEDTMTIEIG